MTDYTLSQHTITRYQQVTRILPQLYLQHTNQPFHFPNSLQDSQLILHILSNKYQPNTLRNCFSAIIWWLRSLDQLHPLLPTYSLLRDKSISDSFAHTLNPHKTLSLREQRTFQSWPNILLAYQRLTDSLQPHLFQSFLDYLILSLYILHPPVRADYANMHLFIDQSLVPPHFPHNYCILQTNPRFVFQKYKTYKKYGIRTIPILPQLHDILLQWTQLHNPSDFLLVHPDLTPYSEAHLSHRIPIIFLKYSSIPSTINSLRHAFLSHHPPTLHNIHNATLHAQYMMHSTPIAAGYQRNSCA